MHPDVQQLQTVGGWVGRSLRRTRILLQTRDSVGHYLLIFKFMATGPLKLSLFVLHFYKLFDPVIAIFLT